MIHQARQFRDKSAQKGQETLSFYTFASFTKTKFFLQEMLDHNLQWYTFVQRESNKTKPKTVAAYNFQRRKSMLYIVQREKELVMLSTSSYTNTR